MASGLQPLRKARRGLWNAIGRRDADGVEAERLRPRDERRLQPLRGCVRLVQRRFGRQKSGSA
jgi:hypothetical protein